jgi:hypothetical protein
MRTRKREASLFQQAGIVHDAVTGTHRGARASRAVAPRLARVGRFKARHHLPALYSQMRPDVN